MVLAQQDVFHQGLDGGERVQLIAVAGGVLWECRGSSRDELGRTRFTGRGSSKLQGCCSAMAFASNHLKLVALASHPSHDGFNSSSKPRAHLDADVQPT